MVRADFGDRIARVVGLALGIGLVAAALFAVRPAGGHGGVLPASLRMTIAQDGAIAAAPAAPRPFLRGRGLRPGSHVSGTVRLTNQTGKKMLVGLVAHPSSTALDGLAQVRIEAGERVLADTTLQALREGSAGTVPLAPGAAAKLRVTASLPAEAETGYEGAAVEVAFAPTYGGAR